MAMPDLFLNLIKNVEDHVVFLFEKGLILIYYQLVLEPEKRKAKGIRTKLEFTNKNNFFQKNEHGYLIYT